VERRNVPWRLKATTSGRMTTNCSPTNVPLAILQTDLNSRTHERCNRSVELSTLRSVPSLGIVPWFPRSFLPQKNPRIVVFRRCRDNTMISFYLSFTDDTIKRKRNARETETTADTKETEKASRYDEDRHLLHDGQFPWTVQKVRSLRSNFLPRRAILVRTPLS
jgi:hypothetical protein